MYKIMIHNIAFRIIFISLFIGCCNSCIGQQLPQQIDASIQKCVLEENIDKFNEEYSNHMFAVAISQNVEIEGLEDISIRFSIDTLHSDFTEYKELFKRFELLEFFKGEKLIGSYFDDEGWTFCDTETNKTCNIHKLGPVYALIFQQSLWPYETPSLAIFVLYQGKITLVYHKAVGYIKKSEIKNLSTIYTTAYIDDNGSEVPDYAKIKVSNSFISVTIEGVEKTIYTLPEM